VQQVSYGPLIMRCYTGFSNVQRGWQSLNTGPRFYLRLIRRTGWLWLYTSSTTDERPFKSKKLSVPFLYPGVPVGLTPFRGLVPLGRRNLVPSIHPAQPLGSKKKIKNKIKTIHLEHMLYNYIFVYKSISFKNCKIVSPATFVKKLDKLLAL
jgi:hypothetical protein